MWTIFKVFFEFVTILLMFYGFFFFFFLAMRHVRSYLPDQGLNPHPLHWKGKSKPLDCQGSRICP